VSAQRLESGDKAQAKCLTEHYEFVLVDASGGLSFIALAVYVFATENLLRKQTMLGIVCTN
jgi:hypothetical protein